MEGQCPEQVPLLQEARKWQRSLLASNFVSNFVDRESERPALTLNDFLLMLVLKISKGSGKDRRGTLSLNYLSFSH
jgi:hypothetical protein